MPSCDIIMPVYNNAAVLPLTLQALFSQNIPSGWQVQLIMSDDGSSDGTLKVPSEQTSSWPIQIVTGQHSGPAGARNRALDKSQADIIFFLGADILLRPNALLEHLNFHSNNPQPNNAAFGFINWDPRLKPSPLMEYMTHSGPQNDFDSLLGKTTADPQHYFYAAQLSLKRSILPTPAFSNSFTQYGWEDIALGRALSKKKLELYVLHKALALHHHYYSVSNIKHRQLKVGAGIHQYQKQFPNEQLLPETSKLIQFARRAVIFLGAIPMLELLTALTARYNISMPRLFQRFTSRAFWQGYYRNTPKLYKNIKS